MIGDKMRHCCYLYPDMPYRYRCHTPAEFEVVGIPPHPDDTTDSCERHLGVMMGTPDWRKEPDEGWSVFPI